VLVIQAPKCEKNSRLRKWARTRADHWERLRVLRNLLEKQSPNPSRLAIERNSTKMRTITRN
jgi:hypothetical protein